MNLQQVFDPQVVVIGGGIVRLGYWWDRLQEAVALETRPRSLSIRLKRANCGPQAGVIGAARLAMLMPARPARVMRQDGRRSDQLAPLQTLSSAEEA